MAGSVEEAVYVWAAAWANRKPDQVASFYSPQFQSTELGGATAYIEDLKQQVASGDVPDARLEELKTKDAGTDRKVVTFVQRFGKDALRQGADAGEGRAGLAHRGRADAAEALTRRGRLRSIE